MMLLNAEKFIRICVGKKPNKLQSYIIKYLKEKGEKVPSRQMVPDKIYRKK